MNILKSHKIARLGTVAIAGALMVGLASGAHAQGGGQGGRGNMTPEQRQQFMAQFEAQRNQAREDWQRQAMTAAGITDVATQTAVIDFEKKQAEAKTTLLEQARALSTLITTPTTPDATLKSELAKFRAAVAAFEKQQAADLLALDGQTKYSTSPRIEGLFTLLGVLGGETTTLGGLGTIFTDSPYGANARGGRGQGGRGGQGGQGQAGGFAAGGQGGQGGQGGRRNRNRGNQAGGDAAAPAQN